MQLQTASVVSWVFAQYSLRKMLLQNRYLQKLPAPVVSLLPELPPAGPLKGRT